VTTEAEGKGNPFPSCDRDGDKQMRLYIKYCGGCNPVINRKKIVDEVVHKLQRRTALELVGDRADIGLIVGGCPVCCVNMDEVRPLARRLVTVGGELVNFVKVPIAQLSEIIVEQILNSFDPQWELPEADWPERENLPQALGAEGKIKHN